MFQVISKWQDNMAYYLGYYFGGVYQEQSFLSMRDRTEFIMEIKNSI